MTEEGSNGKDTSLAKRNLDQEWAIFQIDKQEVKELVESSAGPRGLTPFRLERVKVPSGGSPVWMLPTVDGERAVDEISGIVVMIRDARAYWRTPYGKGERTPPDCSSDDTITGRGLRWDEDDEDKPHDCSTCPMNQWGSEPKAKRGKACPERKSIFILQKDTLLPLLLVAPPTSLDSVEKYFLRLMNHAHVPYWKVITKFALAKDKNDAGNEFCVIKPSLVRKLTPEEVDFMRSYIAGIRPVLERERVEHEDLSGGGAE